MVSPRTEGQTGNGQDVADPAAGAEYPLHYTTLGVNGE